MAASSSIIHRYTRIWWRLVGISFANNSASRLEFVCYVISKLLRMAFFFIFAYTLVTKTGSYAGYAQGEVLLFATMMNLIDIALQLFYRGLTILPRLIRSGDFDFTLVRPVSPFFWSTFCIFDFFDLTTAPVGIGLFFYAVYLLPYDPSLSAWALGLFCTLIGFALAMLVNILISSLAFWSPEIENGVWLYRDLSYISRFPSEIFPRAIQWILTFVIPVFMIAAFPAKALMGRLPTTLIIASVVLTILLALFTRHIWKTGLSRYTSASS
jgi:ABC-2 type transport system permease protein